MTWLAVLFGAVWIGLIVVLWRISRELDAAGVDRLMQRIRADG